MRRGKYNARKVRMFGILFDSRHEADRYLVLRDLERKGEISDLRLQVPFLLIPVQREPDTVGPRGGIQHGRLLEKSCVYNADFTYRKDGNLVVEDAKGVRTDDYVIKRKLMLKVLGIRVEEV